MVSRPRVDIVVVICEMGVKYDYNKLSCFLFYVTAKSHFWVILVLLIRNVSNVTLRLPK